MIKKISANGSSEESLDRAYLCLLGLLDSNIKERHKGIQSKVTQKVNIKFSDIKKIVDKNHELPSKKYTVYYMKNEFQKMSIQYLEEIIESEYNENDLSKQSVELFKQTIGEIYALNDKEFYDFCLKISPDNDVTDEDTNNAMKFLTCCLPKQGLENCYFEILKQIRKKVENKKWVYYKKMNNNKNVVYLPSTILDDDTKIKNNLLVKRIHNNDNPDLLREVEKIITKNVTISSIDDSKIYSNIPEPEDDQKKNSERYYDRITIMKKISLINIEDAKEELK